MEGYIKLHRKIIETSFWSNHNAARLAIYFICTANFREKKTSVKYQEVIVKRGQILTGRKKIALETGLSEQNVRTAINFLATIGFLTIKSTSSFSLITIIKYEAFQERARSTNQQTNQQVTNKQPTSNQQVTTTEECKERKNVKNVKNKHIVRTPEITKILESLKNKIADYRPNHKPIDINKGHRIIQKMIRIDKRTIEDMQLLVDWYPIGEQFIPEIFSVSSFREKYDKLYSAYQRAKSGNGGQPKSKYDHNMEVAKRMIKKAQEEKESGQDENLQIAGDVSNCFSGQKDK